jgi:hypothetical protein
MYNFNDLKVLTEKSKKITEKNEDVSNEAFISALELLEKFHQSKIFNKELLHKATLKLIESLKHKSNNIEPYLALIYIFYIMDEIETAIKYLRVANDIDSESPLIKSAREFLEKGTQPGGKVLFEKNLTTSDVSPPQIKKIKSIRRLSVSKGDS